MKRYLALLAFLLWSVSAHAIEEQIIYSEEVTTYTLDQITDQISNYTTTPEDRISWKLFSETEEIPYSITRDGDLWEGLKPVFTEGLKKLDGTKVKMAGYMFPLDQTEGQSQFLFGPFPLTCPYHYHSPNSLTIEAHAVKPITFSYEAITIEGILELVPEDYEYNTFYRLKNVKIIE